MSALVDSWSRLTKRLDPGLFRPAVAEAPRAAEALGWHPDLQTWVSLHAGGPLHVPSPDVRFYDVAEKLANPAWAAEFETSGIPLMNVEGFRMVLQRDGSVVNVQDRTEAREDGGVEVTGIEISPWMPSLAAVLDRFVEDLDAGEVVYVPACGRTFLRGEVPTVTTVPSSLQHLTGPLVEALEAGKTVRVPSVGVLRPTRSGGSLQPKDDWRGFGDANIVAWPGLGMLTRVQRRGRTPGSILEVWRLEVEPHITPRVPQRRPMPSPTPMGQSTWRSLVGTFKSQVFSPSTRRRMWASACRKRALPMRDLDDIVAPTPEELAALKDIVEP